VGAVYVNTALGDALQGGLSFVPAGLRGDHGAQGLGGLGLGAQGLQAAAQEPGEEFQAPGAGDHRGALVVVLGLDELRGPGLAAGQEVRHAGALVRGGLRLVQTAGDGRQGAVQRLVRRGALGSGLGARARAREHQGQEADTADAPALHHRSLCPTGPLASTTASD
jgi:hypothetical protein